MSVSGPLTTHGIPKFADTDVPDLGAGGVGTILDTLDGLIGLYKIAPTVTITSPVASVDFSSIPQTFQHLEITFALISDAAADNDVVGIRFNGDATANYDNIVVEGSGAAVSATTNTAEAFGRCGRIAGATGQAGAGQARVSYYSNSAAGLRKSSLSKSSAARGTGSLFWDDYAAWWRNTGAVTRVTLLPLVGSHFTAGVVSLYALL